jgi:hypothetical protein
MNTSDIAAKRAAALKLMTATGIWRDSYQPLAFRLLWRFGIDVPPPHFVAFHWTALCAGGYFAIIFGLGMWLFPVMHQGYFPMRIILVSAGCAGLIFGVGMAGYYAYGRRKHAIPLWQDFNPAKEPSQEEMGGNEQSPKNDAM